METIGFRVSFFINFLPFGNNKNIDKSEEQIYYRNILYVVFDTMLNSNKKKGKNNEKAYKHK